MSAIIKLNNLQLLTFALSQFYNLNYCDLMERKGYITRLAIPTPIKIIIDIDGMSIGVVLGSQQPLSDYSLVIFYEYGIVTSLISTFTSELQLFH